MTIRTTLADFERLTDERLIVAIRDAIAAAAGRPKLKAELRRVIADTLSEFKAEMIVGANLSAEEIAAESMVDPITQLGIGAGIGTGVGAANDTAHAQMHAEARP